MTDSSKLTAKQEQVLNGLKKLTGEDQFKNGVPARRLADELESPGYGAERFSYDEVYAQLESLEQDGAVKRHIRKEDGAVKWVPVKDDETSETS